ncbi:MAG: hypothetical protein M3Z20_04640 [Chloroflexota bacterium]|nr:hypothetical protein [Chloroflexota bacterium]
MVGLVALIALITFVARFLRRGDAWPMACLLGVKHTLLGVTALYGLLVVLAVGAGATRAILHPVADAMIALFPDGQPPASQAGQRLDAPSIEIAAAVTPPLPTPTPRVVAAHAPQPRLRLTPTSLSYEAVAAPLRTPDPAALPTMPPTPSPGPTTLLVTPPTATPAPARSGCDPAYPDADTCIPPGPPWDQGCAITAERRFAVLPPDPQGLDHDGDGIGCEPIT